MNMGMMLGLRVTAEGIEGSSQLACLRTMGCELGQGFIFARPMDATAMLEAMGQPARNWNDTARSAATKR